LSQRVEGERYEISFGRIDAQGKLPTALSKANLATDPGSLAEPTLARAGDQLWLSYHFGDRRKDALMVMPVDANFARAGSPYPVVPADPGVHESILVGLDNGELLAVYIKAASRRS